MSECASPSSYVGAAVTTGWGVGYACVNTQLPSSARTLRLARLTPERLRELIASNLNGLETILRWNAAHGIEVFRLTSNLIPLGSHPANELAWWEEFAGRLGEIGALARAEGMRLSTHPGQYTVLSSAVPRVVAAAVAELEYHDRSPPSASTRPTRSSCTSGAVSPTGWRRTIASNQASSGYPTARAHASCSRTTSAGRSIPF
jgi:UV-endonuclease UvdE